MKNEVKKRRKAELMAILLDTSKSLFEGHFNIIPKAGGLLFIGHP